MERRLLVAAQLSSLFPSSQVSCIPIQTSRRDTPLPPVPRNSDPPPEHASYSTLLDTPTTGSVLLRVIHGGLIIELISLSTEVPPIRFVFPAAVVSSPAVFLWDQSQLHIIAVTVAGALYRVVIPVGVIGPLWQNHPDRNWVREHLISHLPDSRWKGLVHVQGTHSVAIGFPNGSVLRLETEWMGTEEQNDVWSESLSQPGSFLHSLTSFLPSLSSTNSNGSEIISMASHPWPTDIGHVWTLSRDRSLRLWKARIGCVATRTLSLNPSTRDSTPGPGTPKPQVLLEAEQQTLLRVFTREPDDERIYVLAFIPTPSSSTAGGSFRLLDTEAESLSEIGTIECSKESAYCHLQDFIVANDTLYTLWDRQGRSFLEAAVINFDAGSDLHPGAWTQASYAEESELTPAYLEELLLSPGSLTDKFFEAIMRPGIFSALTLRTAIDQYTDACLSLPGPPPIQLNTIYATLGENIAAVVGCTVQLIRDPSTGALQHAQYWNALKRDWEGFIARCREVERSARWPLVLGAQAKGDILLIERERVGRLVTEDYPIGLHRSLLKGIPLIDPQYDLLDTVWALRVKLGTQTMLNLENRLVDIVQQEIAFSFVDILQDQTRRSKFREEMEEGLESWIIGRLQRIDNLDSAAQAALDVIGGFDVGVKREEEEVPLRRPPVNSDWSKALTATYVTTSIHARYELCLSLLILLFFLSDELDQWDPTLLAEMFSVFRGISTLRYVSRQPAGDLGSAKPPAGDAADEVITRLRNMNVSRHRTVFTPTHSLIHRLISHHGDLPNNAHRFLDSTGLLQCNSPAYATKPEVVFCEQLRLLGYHGVARELLSWLPRTPGVTYVLARVWLDIGRSDDASYTLQKIAGSFGTDNALSQDDRDSLAAVLPAAVLLDSEFSYYLHTAGLFKSVGLVSQETMFTQLALSVASQDVDTSALWLTVIRGYIDLALYDEAYSALLSTPYDKQKRECVSHLVYRMCEDNAVEKLMTFNFAGFADEVEECLSFKARNVDPRVRPFYSRILYTWFILRGDYRNAALTMYQRARKLCGLITDTITFFSLAEAQLESYMIAMNALSLLDQKNAWIIMPVSHENSHEPRKRRKLSKHIPESKYAPGKYDAEIVDLTDIQYEYALLSSQADVVRKDPELLSSGEFLLPPSSIVLRLAQLNRFNTALATARSLNVDMTDLFAQLTIQCLRLSRNPDAVMQEDTSDWLLTDKISSWSGTPADKGWRHLRQSLERHDNAETDYRYSKVTLETILSSDGSCPPPPWLIQSLEEHHPEFLIRTSLRYELLESAMEHTISLIQKADSQVARDPPKTASATWLPYTLIDQVIVTTSDQDDLSPHGQDLRLKLQTELANRLKRMQKLSQF